MFHIKVVEFKVTLESVTYIGVTLASTINVNFKFFNENSYSLLHFLVVDLESFSKHYNKVIFH
jgi:hypothetical protein